MAIAQYVTEVGMTFSKQQLQIHVQIFCVAM